MVVASAMVMSLLLSLATLTISFLLARRGLRTPYAGESAVFSAKLTFIRRCIAQPAAVILVGLYVGFLAPKNAVWIVLISVIPALLWFLTIDSWRWDGWKWMAIYGLLALGTASLIGAWRRQAVRL